MLHGSLGFVLFVCGTVVLLKGTLAFNQHHFSQRLSKYSKPLLTNRINTLQLPKTSVLRMTESDAASTAASSVLSSISSLLPKLPVFVTTIIALSILWTNFMPYQVSADSKYPIRGEETIMAPKAHGTSDRPVQTNLRWKVDNSLADRIVNYNRKWAEHAGYWNQESDLIKEIDDHIKHQNNEPIQFFDSVTGKLLFTAPIGRSYQEFKEESLSHGWPSFRDAEVSYNMQYFDFSY